MSKEFTDFERGMKYNEAIMFEFITRYPNDKELGANIRDLVKRMAQNNPYKETIKDIAIKTEKQIAENRKTYKNNKT